ncbi:MAG: UDP-N-acetylglucosamine 2-epimerase (hydrolyzing) [Candidatus Riflebacteria bacterium]|nr:UDP-N-acetylglucosamine 2-epimerase (hydrolyzing) [Candidatus Riflebacteria bacterium]
MRKICFVTGTRADCGMLLPVMSKIKKEPVFKLQIIATGMHLSPEFGLTYKMLEEEGFQIDEKVEMLLSSDTPVGIAKSAGLGTIGFADSLNRLKPDLLVLPADRFEIFAAAQAALFADIPIAHIAGGDTTEGAFDESIRHCITKMSHIHFVTNALSGKRVVQMGENAENVHVVGTPAIDLLHSLKLLEREKVEKKLSFSFRQKNILVTFHPVTLEKNTSEKQCRELLAALAELGDSFGLIFTKSNADTDGRIISQLFDDFAARHENAKVFSSLGQLLYLSTMNCVDVVVGNSSSGLYEAPSLKKPAVNIGDRQKGRLKADSVIDSAPSAKEIYNAVIEATKKDCTKVENPYGDGKSSERIIQILKNYPDFSHLLKKHFHLSA